MWGPPSRLSVCHDGKVGSGTRCPGPPPVTSSPPGISAVPADVHWGRGWVLGWDCSGLAAVRCHGHRQQCRDQTPEAAVLQPGAPGAPEAGGHSVLDGGRLGASPKQGGVGRVG